MIWSRKSIAELGFPIAVDASSDVPGFPARQLLASAPFAGLRDVFLRYTGGAPDYFYARQLIFVKTPDSHVGSWYSECVLYPVDPALTPAAAKKRALAGGEGVPRPVGTVYFVSGVHEM